MALDIKDFEPKITRINSLFSILYIFLILMLILGSYIILVNFDPINERLPYSGPEDPLIAGDFASLGNDTSDVFIQLSFILLIFISGSIISINLKQRKMSSLVSDFFETYHITRLKNFNGQIQFGELNIDISWEQRKNYFILKNENETLSYTKPKELYWKILYWAHKLSYR